MRQYLLLLDHDILPVPKTLHQAIPVFDTSTRIINILGFVKLLQRFYGISINDIFYAGDEVFHDGVQLNR